MHIQSLVKQIPHVKAIFDFACFFIIESMFLSQGARSGKKIVTITCMSILNPFALLSKVYLH